MIGNRIQQARFSSDFYRNYYHKILNGLLILSIITLLLVGYIIYLVATVKPPLYYATTLGGQTIPMKPLS